MEDPKIQAQMEEIRGQEEKIDNQFAIAVNKVLMPRQRAAYKKMLGASVRSIEDVWPGRPLGRPAPATGLAAIRPRRRTGRLRQRPRQQPKRMRTAMRKKKLEPRLSRRPAPPRRRKRLPHPSGRACASTAVSPTARTINDLKWLTTSELFVALTRLVRTQAIGWRKAGSFAAALLLALARLLIDLLGLAGRAYKVGPSRAHDGASSRQLSRLRTVGRIVRLEGPGSCVTDGRSSAPDLWSRLSDSLVLRVAASRWTNVSACAPHPSSF